MHGLTPLASPAELAGPWCNADAVTSATVEAISFVTPALERLFIRTVADCLPIADDPALERQCREFIREEAEHTGAHRKLNAALLDYLQSAPPGLVTVERLLELADRRLPLSGRAALVAALEHFTAVFSKSWLRRQTNWRFACAYARDLFEQHAHEEIAHRAVAFDLWRHRGGGGILARVAAMATILIAGAAYLGVAVPWILRRKASGEMPGVALPRRPAQTGATRCSTLRDLLRYLRPDYHPGQLVAAPLPPAPSRKQS